MRRRRNPFLRFFADHPRTRTAIILVLLGLWVAVEMPGLARSGQYGIEPWRAWVLAILTVLPLVGLLWRNRWPLGVFLAVFAMDLAACALLVTASTPNVVAGSFAGAVALYSVAKWRSPRVSWTCMLVQCTATAVFLAFVLFQEDTSFPVLIFVLASGTAAIYAGGAGVVLVGMAVRRERLHEEDLNAWAVDQRERAQLAERSRIAREMHDVVAHSLTVMITLADGAKVLSKSDPQKAAEVMGEVSKTGRSALADMRRVLGILKVDGEPAAARAPIAAREALAELVAGFRRAGVPVTLIHSGYSLPEDPAFVQTVFRIIQESLTNVLRYAKSASEVIVETHSDGEGVRVRVADNGLGVAPERSAQRRSRGEGLRTEPGQIPGTGNGLEGLRTRAHAFGGTLRAGPGPAQGWIVEAVFPPNFERRSS
ncbi:sensor histidine kinase [Falsarthrobacter nasiphocae]